MPPRTRAAAKLQTAANDQDARAAALDAFLAAQEKDAPGEFRRLDDHRGALVPVISTGAVSLDYAICAGGIPFGRITEIYGPESSGKTTLALVAARNAQLAGHNVAIVDAEHALNIELCRNIGLDEHKVVLTQPNSGEDCITAVEKMLASGAFGVIIVDSVAAMVPLAELQAEVDQSLMGTHARLMSRFMRRVAGTVGTSGVALILINQVRKDLTAYGAPDTTTGGRAIRFYASLRIEVRAGSKASQIEKGGVVIGVRVKATVKKNKLGAPFRSAEYDVIFGRGIDGTGSLLDVALDLGVVQQMGQTFYLDSGEKLGVYKSTVKDILSEDPQRCADLDTRVRAALLKNSTGPAPDLPGLLDDTAEAEPAPSGELVVA